MLDCGVKLKPGTGVGAAVEHYSATSGRQFSALTKKGIADLLLVSLMRNRLRCSRPDNTKSFQLKSLALLSIVSDRIGTTVDSKCAIASDIAMFDDFNSKIVVAPSIQPRANKAYRYLDRWLSPRIAKETFAD